MVKPTYIKVDGVSLSVEWVKSMTFPQFKSDAQVLYLFRRVPEDKRSEVLATVYETVTGKKAKSGGAKPQPVNDVTPDAAPVEQPESNSSPMVGE